jgi:hypothetical protein
MQLTFFGRARGEPDRRRHGSEINQHLAAEQVGKRGRLSAIRHVPPFLNNSPAIWDVLPTPADAMVTLRGLALT